MSPLDPRRSPPATCAVLALAALGAAIVALGVGPLPIGPGQVLASLLQPLGIVLPMTPQPFDTAVILQIRLPRVLLGLLVGGALAQAGAAMQGIFRNPLADPSVIGVSGGAALAAACVIVTGGIAGPYTLPLAAFAGGALATWTVARLGQVDGATRVAQMLLAGLAVNAICGAGIGFLTQLASDTALRNLTFWLFGSLGRATWPQIAVAGPLLLASSVLIPRYAQPLNALLLGEAEAGHLGVHVERLKRTLTLLVVLAVGVSVALCGIIGFIGLVVPHLIRLWAGPDHRLLLPASALLGATLLVAADTAARTVLAPAELPIGILTALVGGPFFIALLLRFRRDADIL